MERRREFYMEKRIAHQKLQKNGTFQRTLAFGVSPAALPEGGAFSLPDL